MVEGVVLLSRYRSEKIDKFVCKHVDVFDGARLEDRVLGGRLQNVDDLEKQKLGE